MKHIVILSMSLFAGVLLQAQSVSPQVLASSGSSFSSSNARVDFTIGEAVTSSLTAGNVQVTQGFHQPEIKFSGLEDFADEYTFNLYPNPTVQYVTLNTSNSAEMKIHVYDMNGKTLIHSNVFISAITLDLSSLSAGNYVLMVSSVSGQPLKSYSVIKSSEQ